MNKPRKAKSKRLQPLPLDESETKCGICLDKVVKRGKIGPCSHLYCYSCLLEWSKLNNTCPQCKLTFRCITRVHFETDTFEEKVFIKDKTLRTGHVSSDEEYDYVNSPDIEDSDPDFIEYDDIAEKYSDSEAEAQFTQRKRKCSFSPQKPVSTRRKSSRMFSDSDSEENNANYMNIFNSLKNGGVSPKTYPNDLSPSNCKMDLSPSNCKMDQSPQSPDLFGESPKPSSSCTKRQNDTKFKCPLVSMARSGRSLFSESVTNKSSKTDHFTSPEHKNKARWARLDQKVRDTKRKRTMKSRKPTKAPITISTVSSSSDNSSQWFTTRKTNKERSPLTKCAINNKFKVPFKKSASPEKLYEDPERYFASIIDKETS